MAAVGNLGGTNSAFQLPAFQFAAVTLAAVLTVPAGDVPGIGLFPAPLAGAPVPFAAFVLTTFVIGPCLIIHRPEAVDGVFLPLLILNPAFFMAALLRRAPILLPPFRAIPTKYIRGRHLFVPAIAGATAIVTASVTGTALLRFGEIGNFGFCGFFGKICHHAIITAIGR